MEMVKGFSELSLEEMEMVDGGWWQTLLSCIAGVLPSIGQLVAGFVPAKTGGIVSNTLGAISGGITSILGVLGG